MRGLAVLARIGAAGPGPSAFEIDLDAFIDLGAAAMSDSLADTANYADLAREISGALERVRYDDLAEAADAVAGALLAAEHRIEGITLTLRDPRTVPDSATGRIGVSISRTREQERQSTHNARAGIAR
ncbi:MAG: dihydroneopterin aldolase [Bradyrhizobium sp.]